jgi:hypothetical protein
MSELLVAEAIQDVLQGMSEFDDADVTISDWKVLDGSSMAAPFAIIKIAGDFGRMWRTKSAETTYNIPVEIYVKFTEWSTTLLAFRALRQAILDIFDTAPGVVAGFRVNSIRSGSGIGEVYEKYIDPALQGEAIPQMLMQVLMFNCEEF